MSIWDTAGQEKYKSMNRNFYAGSHGVILCFDLTKDVDENGIMEWINEVNDNIDAECFKVIVGTKNDAILPENKTNLTIHKVCEELSIPYLSTSATEGTNIKETFDIILFEIEKKQEDYKNHATSSILFNRNTTSVLSLVDNNYVSDSSVPKKNNKKGACC